LAIDEAEVAAHALGDDALLADVHSYRGGLEYMAGNLDAARGEYEQATELLRTQSATARVSVMEHDLGLISVIAKDYVRARAHFEESLRIARENGLDVYAAGVLGSIGYLELEEGNLAEADFALKQGLRFALDRGAVDTSTAHDVYTLAAVTVSRGLPSAACLLLGACDAAFDLAGAAREPTAERAREETLRQAEATIGREATADACARGRELTVVEAVEYALSMD